MNRSLYYIIPIGIALIGLVAWMLSCPLWILIPLIASLGAAHIGWRIGLVGIDSLDARKNKEIANYKNQLGIASTSVAHASTSSSSTEEHQSEVLQLQNKIKELESEQIKIQQDWQSKYKILEASNIGEQNAHDDWRQKYDELLDQHTQSIKEWEAKYSRLQERNQSMQASILTASEGQIARSKYDALKNDYDEAIQTWNKQRQELEHQLMAAPKVLVNEVQATPEAPVVQPQEPMIQIKKEIVQNDQDSKSDDIDELLDDVPAIDPEMVLITDNQSSSGLAPANLETIDGDDLTKIKGIGGAVKKLLNKHGILTFTDLSKVNKSALLGMLDSGGIKFKDLNPKTWSEQAKLAAKGQWEALQKFQDKTP